MSILVPKLLSLYRMLSFMVFGLPLLRIFGANTNAFHIFPKIMVFLHRLISHRLRGGLLKIAQITGNLTQSEPRND
jgi:small neutral amino acid transporter SnatA (MarC family)